MRDNSNTVQYTIQPNSANFRSTFAYHEAKPFLRSPQNKVFINTNFTQMLNLTHSQQVNRTPPNPKLEMPQKNVAKDTYNNHIINNTLQANYGRRNTVDIHPDNKPANGFVSEQRLHDDQKESDLRGSCPNIFRKLQQHSSLRNTTHFNNLLKLNIQNQATKVQQKQPNVIQSSFLKQPQKVNTYFVNPSQISTSIVLQSQQQQQLSKIQADNSNKEFNSLPHDKKQFTSLNQIIINKQMQKSLEGHFNGKVQRSKVINGFEIGKSLGKGRFGQVYLSKHQLTGFLVALKKIIKAKVSEYKMIEQLKDQIKLHSALLHPHIVRFYGFFQDEENIYLILQYMNGGTLFDYLSEKEKLGIKQAVDILRDIISAVQHLHNMHVAHRDIKPQNIVLSTEGVAKLCDFGWSALVENSRKTYCGTFDYVPPQVLERKNYDQSVDIWCIGVLTYELLTGKVPFEGEIRNVVMNKIINVDKNKIQYPNEVPAVAKDFIESLVRKDPNDRPKCKDLMKHQLFIQYPPKNKKNDVK